MADPIQNPLHRDSESDIETLFAHAVALNKDGRIEDAKNAYLEILQLDPTHFGSLNNLGALLMTTGYKTAARTAYGEAVKHHPQNPMGHINLANALAKNHETEAALEHFARALELAPDHPKAHQGLALLLSELGEEDKAVEHRIKGFRHDPVLRFPYYGSGNPIELLVLASASGGTVPVNHHLDNTVFSTTVIFVDFYDMERPLPHHHLVFNAIGDADICRASLDLAEKILSRVTAPVINQPSSVLKTGRANNAQRFAKIEGVIAPKIKIFPRHVLEKDGAVSALAHDGFSFPLLLRSPGFHAGKFFTRVEDENELSEVLPSIPGHELMVIDYLDTRSRDQKFRKYRVMIVDGMIYPLHAAISSKEWKLHYFSADMTDNPDHRAEDEAFLNDMPKALGPKAMRALEAIRNEMELDYAGIDFGLSPEGDIFFFEANATMVVLPPDKDIKWDYRRPAVKRILDALHVMLDKKARTRLQAN